VAIAAHDRGVSSRQRELSLRMPQGRKGRRLETNLRVATVTFIGIAWTGKLSAVRIRMAFATQKSPRNVDGALALWLMALHTIERGMFPFKHEGTLLMRVPCEQRRLETGFIVASRTLGAGRALGELPSMNILVTVPAMLMSDGTPEVAVLMALDASRGGVFAVQRELRSVVIETDTRLILIPTAGLVARLAGALKLGVLKRSLVGIGVAALAARESKFFIARHLLPRDGCVAFLTHDSLMLSGQWICGQGMVEEGRRIPGVLGVTPEAISSKLSPMHIIMTSSTLAAQAKERTIQIL
jgi:hypothetical protein